MSDETKIEPALSAEGWAAPSIRIFSDDEKLLAGEYDQPQHPAIEVTLIGGSVRIDCADPYYSRTVGQEHLAPLIAVLNAALPDSDPRKITREWIDTLRSASVVFAVGGYGEVMQNDDRTALLHSIADALDSYLRPE